MSKKRSKEDPELTLVGSNRGEEIGRTAVHGDPELIARGWVRRHLVDLERAREAVELYTSIGYEVKVKNLTPAELQSTCLPCAPGLCRSCVVIYTRK